MGACSDGRFCMAPPHRGMALLPCCGRRWGERSTAFRSRVGVLTFHRTSLTGGLLCSWTWPPARAAPVGGAVRDPPLAPRRYSAWTSATATSPSAAPLEGRRRPAHQLFTSSVATRTTTWQRADGAAAALHTAGVVPPAAPPAMLDLCEAYVAAHQHVIGDISTGRRRRRHVCRTPTLRMHAQDTDPAGHTAPLPRPHRPARRPPRPQRTVEPMTESSIPGATRNAKPSSSSGVQ